MNWWEDRRSGVRQEKVQTKLMKKLMKQKWDVVYNSVDYRQTFLLCRCVTTMHPRTISSSTFELKNCFLNIFASNWFESSFIQQRLQKSWGDNLSYKKRSLLNIESFFSKLARNQYAVHLMLVNTTVARMKMNICTWFMKQVLSLCCHVRAMRKARKAFRTTRSTFRWRSRLVHNENSHST